MQNQRQNSQGNNKSELRDPFSSACAWMRAGCVCLEHVEGASLRSGAIDVPWRDELCCDSPPAHGTVEGGAWNSSEMNRSESVLPQDRRCAFKSSTARSHPTEFSGEFVHWYPTCHLKQMNSLKLVELLRFKRHLDYIDFNESEWDITTASTITEN